MEDFQSKYNGEQVEAILDAVTNGEVGGGGGGITVETDPIFSASPAASITEAKKTEWDNKMDKVTLATVATSGSYNDLSNKPTIPAAVTESTVSGWGFTKNVGTITEIQMNGVSKGTSGIVDLGDTGAYPIVESSETSVTLSANRMTRITTQVVDSLEIILPDEIEGLTSECVVTFNVDPSSAGAELIVPADVRWADGIIPAMTAGKAYEISFLNRCATFLEF